jgi:hypothetical protein
VSVFVYRHLLEIMYVVAVVEASAAWKAYLG